MYHFWYIAFSCGLGFYLGFEKSALNVPFLVHRNIVNCQLRVVNRQLKVVNRQLKVVNRQLRVVNRQRRVDKSKGQVVKMQKFLSTICRVAV